MSVLRQAVSASDDGEGFSDSQSKNDIEGVRPVKIHHSHLIQGLKRAVDVAAALFFFFFFGWLYALLWIGVMITSGAPAMYAQLRYGRDGRVFKIYKFRSMVLESEKILEQYLRENPTALQHWQDFQKLENDPRITKLGNFIRKTSLDELPQFWNVLKGDMSLVGPRPCVPNQKDLYGTYWRYYCAVRPGITGLWQVSGRNKLSFKKRVALDVMYVKTLSAKSDCYIFLKTIWVVITRHGAL